jgi:hypothetical protein
MLSDADRRVLAEMESAFRRNDARFVARFDERRVKRRRRRIDVVAGVAVLLTAVGGLAIGGAAVALTWLSVTGSAATVVALRRTMKGRATRCRDRWPG